MTHYKPEYCERLKIHCDNGKSLESFCAAIKVSPKVITEWYLEYPEFKEMVEMAPCLELYYWEMQMLRAIQIKDKETLNVAKSKLDRLTKYVISPLKKNTYSTLKESDLLNTPVVSSGDLIKDLKLLINNADERRENNE